MDERGADLETTRATHEEALVLVAIPLPPGWSHATDRHSHVYPPCDPTHVLQKLSQVSELLWQAMTKQQAWPALVRLAGRTCYSKLQFGAAQRQLLGGACRDGQPSTYLQETHRRCPVICPDQAWAGEQVRGG